MSVWTSFGQFLHFIGKLNSSKSPLDVVKTICSIDQWIKVFLSRVSPATVKSAGILKGLQCRFLVGVYESIRSMSSSVMRSKEAIVVYCSRSLLGSECVAMEQLHLQSHPRF